MSDLLIVTGLLSIGFIIAAFCYAVYSGLLSKVQIRAGVAPVKGMTVAYKYKQGPYKESGALFREAHTVSPSLPTVGIYYDDPRKVPAAECRYAVGSVLSEADVKPDSELMSLYESLGFGVFVFPEVTHAVSTRFPNTTSLSILLAVHTVYPKLSRYVQERNLCAHPWLEIYRDGQIVFMAPLARQGDFYVPEVQEPARRVKGEKEEEEEEDGRTDTTGADSLSDCSSLSSPLASDSRDPSPSATSSSWYRNQNRHRRQRRGSDPAERDDSDQRSERSSSGSSFEELELEKNGAEPGKNSANEKLSHEEQGMVVGGEE